MSRIWNFSAGPAMLPQEVLARAGDEMLDWHGAGMGVMEMSHRGKQFMGIAADTARDLRVPFRRRHAPIRRGTAQPARREGQGGLRNHRRVVEKGRAGSAVFLRRQNCGQFRGSRFHLCAGPGGVETKG